MQTRVISLKRTPERLVAFQKQGIDCKIFEAIDGRTISYPKLLDLGFDTDKNWRDPLLKRGLTHGEIGCFLSHWYLWEECEEYNEPFLILEDDVRLLKKVPRELPEGDIVYLCWNEMMKEGASEDKPCYPYWTSAYIITPKAARYLLQSDFRHNIIPVDEVLPRVTDQLDVRSIDGYAELTRAKTTTEPSNHNDYFIDFDTHVFYVASDKYKAEKLLFSQDTHGVVSENLWPDEKEWNGGLQNFSTGGGVKLNLLKQALAEMRDNDVVIFTDAYDVFFAEGTEEITRRFLSFKTEALFSAERANWPNRHLAWPPSPTPYRYICSGAFMGRVHLLKNVINKMLRCDTSDQLFIQQQYLTGRYDAKMDYEQYIFINNEPRTKSVNGRIFNPVTKCWSCIYHGNGGAEAKEDFDELYRQTFPVRSYAMTEKYEVIANEMLLIDYKTSEQCKEWIDISENHGGWDPHPDDDFPSHDIHLKKLGLWKEAEQHWSEVVAPIIQKYWKPMKHYHLRKAYTMKYSEDTQLSLGLHCDAAMVTGSVKLNDDYEGGILHWPRQEFNNSHIPVGKMILFPSMVTHGHYVDELTKGTKYSATFWSARFKNEYLD